MKFVNYFVVLTIGVCIGYYYSYKRELEEKQVLL